MRCWLLSTQHAACKTGKIGNIRNKCQHNERICQGHCDRAVGDRHRVLCVNVPSCVHAQACQSGCEPTHPASADDCSNSMCLLSAAAASSLRIAQRCVHHCVKRGSPVGLACNMLMCGPQNMRVGSLLYKTCSAFATAGSCRQAESSLHLVVTLNVCIWGLVGLLGSVFTSLLLVCSSRKVWGKRVRLVGAPV